MKRLLLAISVAAIVATIVGWAGFVTSASVAMSAGLRTFTWPAGTGLWLQLYVFFGLPLALLVVGGVVFVRRMAQAPLGASRRESVAIGAVIGALANAAVWGGSFGWAFGISLLPAGILMGAAAGLAFAQVLGMPRAGTAV